MENLDVTRIGELKEKDMKRINKYKKRFLCLNQWRLKPSKYHLNSMEYISLKQSEYFEVHSRRASPTMTKSLGW